MVATLLAPLTFADAEELALYLNCLPESGPPWVPDLGDVAGDLTEFAVYTPAAVDPDAVCGLVGYFLRGPLAMFGEWMDDWADVEQDGHLFRFAPDLTKSRRDDPYWELSTLPDFLAEGSPLRKTDRVGAGTQGTRRWPPLPAGFLLVWR